MSRFASCSQMTCICTLGGTSLNQDEVGQLFSINNLQRLSCRLQIGAKNIIFFLLFFFFFPGIEKGNF